MRKIKVFKLITGEEIVAELRDFRTISNVVWHLVAKPRVICRDGLNSAVFRPWILASDDDVFEIANTSIIAISSASARAAELYTASINSEILL